MPPRKGINTREEGRLPAPFDFTISPDDYKKILARWSYSPARFGLWLGLSERQGRRFAQHGPWPMIARLMMLMVKFKVTPDDFDGTVSRIWTE